MRLSAVSCPCRQKEVRLMLVSAHSLRLPKINLYALFITNPDCDKVGMTEKESMRDQSYEQYRIAEEVFQLFQEKR